MRTHCAKRPSCEIVTSILSAKLVQETSVGMPLTSPFACRDDAGKGSSLTSVEAMVRCVFSKEPQLVGDERDGGSQLVQL